MTLRLRPDTYAQLQRACGIKGFSQSTLIEQALEEYFYNHGLVTRYILMQGPDGSSILVSTPSAHVKILECVQPNGTSPKVLADKFSDKYQQKIDLPNGEEKKP